MNKLNSYNLNDYISDIGKYKKKSKYLYNEKEINNYMNWIQNVKVKTGEQKRFEQIEKKNKKNLMLFIKRGKAGGKENGKGNAADKENNIDNHNHIN